MSTKSFDDAETVRRIRAAHGDYESEALGAEDLAYLESLALPADVDAFYRHHAPTEPVGNEVRLLSIGEMREEHEHHEPGVTLRRLGGSVLMTADGNPYFCVPQGDGYRILLADHDEIGGGEATLDDILEICGDGPSFESFAELLEAFAADVLPVSPYEERGVERLRAWRAQRSAAPKVVGPAVLDALLSRVSPSTFLENGADEAVAELLAGEPREAPALGPGDGELEAIVVWPMAPDTDPVEVIGVDGLDVYAFGADRYLTSNLTSCHVRESTMRGGFQGSFQGLLLDGDTLFVGGANADLHTSTDRGETWTSEAVAQVTAGYPFLTSIVRHDGHLWVSGWRDFIARRVEDPPGPWERVELPGPGGPAPRLVVIGGVLYVLHIGLWRVGAKGLELERELSRDGPTAFLAMTETAAGTLIAVGELGLAFRKPRGGVWTRLEGGAIDFIADRSYRGVIALGADVLLVGSHGETSSFRASSDDGLTFRELPTVRSDGVAVHGKLCERFFTAIPDGHGGALIGGSNGVLLRVARDRLGPWRGAPDHFADAGGRESGNGPDVPISGTASDLTKFAAVYGVSAPPALRRFFELWERFPSLSDALWGWTLDRRKATDVGLWPRSRQENLFTRALGRERSLASGAMAALLFLGSSGGGELFFDTESDQVLFYDRGANELEDVVLAEDLASLVYVSVALRAAAAEKLSPDALAAALARVEARVHLPAAFRPEHGSRGADATPLPDGWAGESRSTTRARGRRSSWISATLAGDAAFDIEGVVDLRDEASAGPLDPAEHGALLDSAEASNADALYGLWRAYLLADARLPEWLALADEHRARLVHDAGRLVAGLANGSKRPPRVKDVAKRLADLRAALASPRSERMSKRLRALEKRRRFTFRDDYRELMTHVASTTWTRVDRCVAWPPVSVPSRPLSKKELDERDATHFYQHVAGLYGIADLEKMYVDVAKADGGDIGFWHVKLLKHAYVVGASAGGDPIVQVTTGKHAGKIFLTNHESYSGLTNLIARADADAFEELRAEYQDVLDGVGVRSRSALRAITTDQLFDLLGAESVDGNVLLANSFADFYAKLCTYFGARAPSRRP